MAQSEEEKSNSKKIEIGDIVLYSAPEWGPIVPEELGIVTSIIHDGDSIVVFLVSGHFFVDNVENFMVL